MPLDHFRLGDAMDIAVVAVVLYASLDWLWRTTYRRLALLALPLGGVLVLAYEAQMHLTLRLLQIVLAVGAVALIVVFQEEVRRGFERLAVSRARSRHPEPHGLVQETVESAFAMANEGTGALIVFEGREPLSRLTSAGIGLDGRVSAVLLRSIFEPRSPGHDGAVVIESGRLSRFAVHLPLAKGAARDVSGTRHAAAVGISERSDALAVVVSEEHGDVSVARGGSLAPVESAQELTDLLARYLERGAEPPLPGSTLPRALRSVALGALALVVSCVLWSLFAAQRAETVQRTYDAAIEYRDAPENLLLEPPVPPTVQLTLSGPAGAVASIDRLALVVGIDASVLAPGRQRRRLTGSDVKLPPDVEVVGLDPEEVDVVARELVAVTLPVRLATAGEAAGIDPTTLVTEPAELAIWLPRSLVGSVDHLETESLDISSLEGVGSHAVTVRLPEGARTLKGEAVVRVRLGRNGS